MIESIKLSKKYKEMADKHNYLWESKGGTEEQKIIRDMAVFSAFGEGLQLFGFIYYATKLSKVW